MTVIVSEVEEALTAWPAEMATAATVPTSGLVRVAWPTLAWATASAAWAASIWAWSAESCSAVAGE